MKSGPDTHTLTCADLGLQARRGRGLATRIRSDDYPLSKTVEIALDSVVGGGECVAIKMRLASAIVAARRRLLFAACGRTLVYAPATTTTTITTQMARNVYTHTFECKCVCVLRQTLDYYVFYM